MDEIMWTTEAPMNPGWYWWRNPLPPWRDRPEMLRVRLQECDKSQYDGMLVVDRGCTRSVGEQGGEWAGPLVPPREG